MILWNKNIEIDENLIEFSYNFVKQDRFFNTECNLYSSFFKSEELSELTNFYSPIIDIFMKDLGLYHRSRYMWNYWIQMYNNKLDGHSVHDHFDFSNIISWIHFIQVPEDQKCFYFLDSNKNKLYPENQSFGDFIVFPPWALHGVDKVVRENFNRIIISGNISLYHIESNTKIWNYTNQEPFIMQV